MVHPIAPRWTLTAWDTFSISSLPLLFVILSTSECFRTFLVKYKKGYEEWNSSKNFFIKGYKSPFFAGLKSPTLESHASPHISTKVLIWIFRPLLTSCWSDLNKTTVYAQAAPSYHTFSRSWFMIREPVHLALDDWHLRIYLHHSEIGSICLLIIFEYQRDRIPQLIF